MRAGSIGSYFVDLFLYYSIPISFIESLISVLKMLTWSSLRRRYALIDSSGGIGNILVMLPALSFFCCISRSILRIYFLSQ